MFVLKEIDNLIEEVSKQIQDNLRQLSSEELSEMIKALAELISARAYYE